MVIIHWTNIVLVSLCVCMIHFSVVLSGFMIMALVDVQLHTHKNTRVHIFIRMENAHLCSNDMKMFLLLLLSMAKMASSERHGLHKLEMWYVFIIIIASLLFFALVATFSSGALILWLLCSALRVFALFCTAFLSLSHTHTPTLIHLLLHFFSRICISTLFSLSLSLSLLLLNLYFRWFFHVCYVFVRTDLLSDCSKSVRINNSWIFKACG